MGSSPFKGKSVLITGGTGTFGKAMAKKLLEEDDLAKVIILSRDEWKQWEMKQSDPIFNHKKIRYFLGSIRDVKRLKLAFRDVDIVIHAAALKQVPAAEYNPSEFIQTNVMGAMHIIEAAIDRKVEKVIALSTDKSVNPVNLYGATKLCSDKLMIAANAYVGDQQTPKFSIVRYGNVLGSRGSIIPLWKQMIQNGAKSLPVTDPEMTRFWIPLETAVDFVSRCADIMRGRNFRSENCQRENHRPCESPLSKNQNRSDRDPRGEKLHELLISPEEANFTFEHSGYYTLLPPVHDRTLEDRIARQRYKGKPVPKKFSYGSDNNPDTWSGEDLKKFL